MKVPEGYDVYWEAVVAAAYNVYNDLVSQGAAGDPDLISFADPTTNELLEDIIEEELCLPVYDFIMKSPLIYSACSHNTSMALTSLIKSDRYTDLGVLSTDVMYGALFNDVRDVSMVWKQALKVTKD